MAAPPSGEAEGASQSAAAGAGTIRLNPSLSQRDLPPPATALLIALLGIDAILVAGHLAFFFLPGWGDARLLLQYEPAGYGELFQYGKLYSLAVVFLACAIWTRQWRWLSWSTLFLVMCLDDSMQLHERLARWTRNDVLGLVGEKQASPRFAGFRWQDIFEAGYMGVLGGVPLLAIILSYRRSARSSRFRRLSHRLAVGLAALVVCGVLMDALHEHRWVKLHRWLDHGLGLADDGGEMVVVTLMVWTVVVALQRDHASGDLGSRAPIA